MKIAIQYSLLMLLLLGTQFSFAQYQIGLVPRTSPDRAVYQKIGLTEVHINYGSPAVKGRTIWGALEPYNEVWRAGANNATTVEFSSDVLIEGKHLPKGKYAFFVIPRQGQKWVAIFSKKAKQWGAFSYDPKEDALRIEVAPIIRATLQEQLSYSIAQTNFDQGSITLSWEKIDLQLNFKTNDLEQFIRTVEIRAEQTDTTIQWVVYLQGAAHLLERQGSLDLALRWTQKSKALSQVEGEWNPQFYSKAYILGHLDWVRAQLYAAKDEYSRAWPLIKALKKSIFYERKKELIDQIINTWPS